MPKIEKAERREAKHHKRINGMRISGKRSMELIKAAIVRRGLDRPSTR